MTDSICVHTGLSHAEVESLLKDVPDMELEDIRDVL
jgi:hypothetical protein